MKDKLEGYGYFAREVFFRITATHPEHRFYFLFERPFDPSFIPSSNVEGVVISPPARHPLLWKIWYDVSIPFFLKKVRADLFVSPDGFCSLSTPVPQCMVAHDLGFLHLPGAYKRSHTWYLKFYTPKFFRKAKRIATVSEFSKEDICKQYKISPQKIDVV